MTRLGGSHLQAAEMTRGIAAEEFQSGQVLDSAGGRISLERDHLRFIADGDEELPAPLASASTWTRR